LSLGEAHRQATALEEEIRRLPLLGKISAPGNVVVNIHIEPLGAHIATADRPAAEVRALSRQVGRFVNGLRNDFPELIGCHEVRVREVEHKMVLSCHCVMQGRLAITAIHDATARLEDRVKKRFPQIAHVTIHPEPDEPE
jgi:hypothetical protein